MQKITYIKHISPLLSLVLLASSAMAMDPQDDREKGAHVQQTAPATATAAANEDEYEEVERVFTRSWFNPAWLVRGGTYTEKVKQKKVKPAVTDATPPKEGAAPSVQARPSVLTETVFSGLASLDKVDDAETQALLKALKDRLVQIDEEKGQ